MTLTLSMRLWTGANWLRAVRNFSIDSLLICPYMQVPFSQHPVISGSLWNCINAGHFGSAYEKNSGRKSHLRWRSSPSRSSAFKMFFSHSKKKNRSLEIPPDLGAFSPKSFVFARRFPVRRMNVHGTHGRPNCTNIFA